jgi:hypothetical protein
LPLLDERVEADQPVDGDRQRGACLRAYFQDKTNTRFQFVPYGKSAEAWESFGAREQETEACAYDAGSLGCRPLAVSSNERVRGLWLVTRNKITGGPPLFIYLAESLLQGGSHNKKETVCRNPI